MEIVWLVIGVTLAATLWFGAARMGARSFGVLGAGLAVLLGSAGLCWLIGEAKTGGYLAGIVGMLLCLLMLIAAGGVLAGTLLRWLYERLSPPAPPRAALRPAWDLMGLGAFAALAVILSAVE
ncbi:hypothetical protein NM680_03755 [Paracoccus sp. PS-1]|uniref:hypothetical protein n=1 Tax=unclassified Paracoccus (in: a-proteobacteria) TaxID=2688777 RepID=UPI00048CD206|nr:MULTISPECIES: hypothetical protein [unclassified Paracoccus (in: a-proteobacteria)]MDQ7260914.1 hypothetical protein [Paracoccus sp. PS1]